jgi:hypothetical protein
VTARGFVTEIMSSVNGSGREFEVVMAVNDGH